MVQIVERQTKKLFRRGMFAISALLVFATGMFFGSARDSGSTSKFFEQTEGMFIPTAHADHVTGSDGDGGDGGGGDSDGGDGGGGGDDCSSDGF